MSLIDKLRKNSTIKSTNVLTDSIFFSSKDVIPLDVPILNAAFCGDLNGGFTPGATVIAGPSKHFKTGIGLLMIRAYMEKYSDAVVLFYDNEFGAPQGYFRANGIDTDRVIHTPITNIEELKFDIMNQLDGLERGDHVIFMIDSVGNVASKKEVEDALEQKAAADMTRAKQIKSLFRMITPHLTMKDLPLIAVNHTYKEQGLYPKDIVSGGTGIYYSADNIFIIGRQQEKDGTEIVGYNFVLNVEKSRFVREKSKFIVAVTYDEGVNKYSGLVDLGLEAGLVVKPKQGWYALVDENGEIGKNWRLDDTNCEEFCGKLLRDPRLNEYTKATYQLGYHSDADDTSA